jgi:type IV secretory pathway VirJ component
VLQANDSDDDIQGLDWTFQDPYSDSPTTGASPVTVTSVTAAANTDAGSSSNSATSSSKLRQLDDELTSWLAAIDRDDSTAAATAADSDKHLSEADRKAAGVYTCTIETSL